MKYRTASLITCFAIGTLATAYVLLGGLSGCDTSAKATGPTYGEKTLEVVLPESVTASVNSFAPDFAVPWARDHEGASIVLNCRQQSKETVIRLRSAAVTHEIVRFEYVVKEIFKGRFTEPTLSLLVFETWEDGVYYGKLILPKECKFFLAATNESYRILSVERADP